MLRSSAARLAASAVSLGLSFVMMPFVLRTLGDHDYGLWVIVASFENYFYFLDLGLNLAASRYVTGRLAARDEDGVNQAVSTAFFVFMGLAIAVACLTLAGAATAGAFVSPEDAGVVRVLLLFAGLTVAIGFPVHAYAGIVYGQMRHDLIELNSIGRRLVEVGLVYLALSSGFGLVAYAAIVSASNLAGSAYFYIVARRIWPAVSVRRRSFSPALAKQFLTYSAWSTLSHFADMIRLRVDALVIGAALGVSAVAPYNVGYKLAEIGVGLVYRATNFMTPLFTRYLSTGAAMVAAERLLALTRVNSFLALTSSFVLVLIGRRFIEIWVGQQYVDAYAVMVVLVAGRVAEAVSTPLSSVVYATASLRFYGVLNLLEAAANAGLSLLLVTRIGIIGVAIGTTIPMVVARLVVLPYYVARLLNIPLRTYYGAVIPSATITGLILAATTAAAATFIHEAGYITLATVAVTAGLLNSIGHYLLTMTPHERSAVRAVALRQLRSRVGGEPSPERGEQEQD